MTLGTTQQFAGAVASEDVTPQQQHPSREDPSPPALRAQGSKRPSKQLLGRRVWYEKCPFPDTPMPQAFGTWQRAKQEPPLLHGRENGLWPTAVRPHDRAGSAQSSWLHPCTCRHAAVKSRLLRGVCTASHRPAPCPATHPHHLGSSTCFGASHDAQLFVVGISLLSFKIFTCLAKETAEA